MRWIYNRERTWIYNSQKKSWRASFCQDFHLLDGRGGGWVVISTLLHSSSSSAPSSLLSLQSKHLKGQLGLRVGHVTFLDQKGGEGFTEARPIQDWLIRSDVETKALSVIILVMFS